MKIILFSDIHANLPAFEKALQLIDAEKSDAIYCLGDLVGYNVWPNEIITEIRKRRIATIAGNHDAKVSSLSPAQLLEPGKNFAYKLISEKNKKHLATLPAHIRLEFQLNGTSLHIMFVHGSPSSNDEYLLEDKPEREFLNVFEKADADILCFGHSHKPYHRVLDTGVSPRRYKHAINTGSIGKPKDGNPQGGFVILTVNENSNAKERDSISVQFIRFDYDIEKAAKAVEESPLPNEFADMLRKAY
jgi:putative phosphoesterase